LEVGSSIPRVRALIERYFAAWVGQVRIWLDAAGTRLPSGLDREAVAHMVLAVAQGGIVQARAAESVDPYDASVGQLRSMFELLVARSRYEHDDGHDVLVGEPAHSDDVGGHVDEEVEWRAW
jgi:hypothetical protein